jgi:hypothetical protein
MMLSLILVFTGLRILSAVLSMVSPCRHQRARWLPQCNAVAATNKGDKITRLHATAATLTPFKLLPCYRHLWLLVF